MRASITPVTVPDDALLHEAVKAIDLGTIQIVLIVDRSGVLKGTVTDGDVRRALLRGLTLDVPVRDVMNTRPLVMGPRDVFNTILRRARNLALRHIPVVDTDGRLLRLELVDSSLDAGVKPNWAVLMAGGLGKRLKPLTDSMPKPLIAVGGKPILEVTLESLAEQGIREFFISVNYRAEMIESHFGDGSAWGVKISYLRESTELGTAGALSVLPRVPIAPLLVMNADVMTSVNVTQMFEYHHTSNGTATIGAFTYEHQIPYGVINIDQDRVTGIHEKPVIRNFVSAGVYVLSPEVLGLVPENERFDMPDLINAVLGQGMPVSAFPIREYWIDIGKHDDLQRAQRDITMLMPGLRAPLT
jgi:dTDP-glucose pyrophosphorylase